MFQIRFFRDAKGKCPVLESLKKLQNPAEAKAYVRIQRLAELGNNLKRPESDYLRDGIYELRWRLIKVQYRLLTFFFFRGTDNCIISLNNKKK